MKNLRSFIFVLSIAPVFLMAQSGDAKKTNLDYEFRLEKWHPYVYLEEDHVGPRQPRSSNEPTEGIWFYLHNNCKEPIIVNTFGTPPNSDYRESGVLDDVVSNPDDKLRQQAEPSVEHWPAEMSAPRLPILPDANQSQQPPSQPVQNDQSQTIPHGYMFPVSSSVTIKPGESIYFSLPINHVGPTWHFEIPFRFALQQNGPRREPTSYISFYWDDLPESYRKVHVADRIQPTRKP
jgi:hypothetical protein